MNAKQLAGKLKPEDPTEKAIEFYNSAACYFAEGVEFMSKEQIYDALKREFDESRSTIDEYIFQ